MAKDTRVSPDGRTSHRCKACRAWFPGTGRKGRPHRLCPECRVIAAAARAARPAAGVEAPPA